MAHVITVAGIPFVDEAALFKFVSTLREEHQRDGLLRILYDVHGTPDEQWAVMWVDAFGEMCRLRGVNRIRRALQAKRIPVFESPWWSLRPWWRTPRRRGLPIAFKRQRWWIYERHPWRDGYRAAPWWAMLDVVLRGVWYRFCDWAVEHRWAFQPDENCYYHELRWFRRTGWRRPKAKR